MGVQRYNLDVDERGVDYGGHGRDVRKELLNAQQWRAHGVAEVLQADVGVSLDEQHALRGAVDGELAALELP